MTSVPEPSPELLQRAGAVRLAAMDLGQTSDSQRAEALHAMADALERHADAIVAANDIAHSSPNSKPPTHGLPIGPSFSCTFRHADVHANGVTDSAADVCEFCSHFLGVRVGGLRGCLRVGTPDAVCVHQRRDAANECLVHDVWK